MERNPNELAKCSDCKLATALQSTASALNQSLRLSEVLERILGSVGQVVPNDAANIMLIENDIARIVACKGYEKISSGGNVIGQMRKISDMPSLVRMMRTGQPIILPDTKESPEWVNFQTSAWIHSYISAPICNQGNVLGYINLNSGTSGLYTPGYAARLVAFADQAAIAIQNAKLYEAAQHEIAERKLAEEALQKALAELEIRVESRTQELRQVNEQLKLELSRRQTVEEELEAERASLEQRIRERTSELSSANAELARASQTKDAFLANMSHELRTPLNAILNVSETLQEQKYGSLNEKQLHLTKTIEDSGRHLLSLINDILDISKIGAGRLELAWDVVPVKALCEASLKLIEEASQKKAIQITTSFDQNVKYIRGDLRRLKQVLVNLLCNAVKFTPHGGTIGFMVRGYADKHQVHFTVWDNGIGISGSDIKLLFKPFTQLDSGLSRQFEGTGLGLALAYHLVELHGGSIQVESQVGSGSRFTVVLEWKDETSATDMGNLQNRENWQNYMEWRDEDLLDPTNLLRGFLKELSIEVSIHFIGASDSSDSPGKQEVGMLILDGYSIEDPFRTLRNLWGQGLYRRIPVIILLPDKRDIDPVTRPERVQVLHAPFTRQDLRNVIKKTSPNGTASLIKGAVIVRERKKTHKLGTSTILIADDNETSVAILSEYLEMHGFRAVTALNGIEAIERAKEVKPDLILMDIQMPKLDGLEAIRSIRKNPEVRQTPIVALTALAMPGDKERCLEAGTNDYISKPVSLKMLLEIIHANLHKGSGEGTV